MSNAGKSFSDRKRSPPVKGGKPSQSSGGLSLLTSKVEPLSDRLSGRKKASCWMHQEVVSEGDPFHMVTNVASHSRKAHDFSKVWLNNEPNLKKELNEVVPHSKSCNGYYLQENGKEGNKGNYKNNGGNAWAIGGADSDPWTVVTNGRDRRDDAVDLGNKAEWPEPANSSQSNGTPLTGEKGKPVVINSTVKTDQRKKDDQITGKSITCEVSKIGDDFYGNQDAKTPRYYGNEGDKNDIHMMFTDIKYKNNDKSQIMRSYLKLSATPESKSSPINMDKECAVGTTLEEATPVKFSTVHDDDYAASAWVETTPQKNNSVVMVPAGASEERRVSKHATTPLEMSHDTAHDMSFAAGAWQEEMEGSTPSPKTTPFRKLTLTAHDATSAASVRQDEADGRIPSPETASDTKRQSYTIRNAKQDEGVGQKAAFKATPSPKKNLTHPDDDDDILAVRQLQWAIARKEYFHQWDTIKSLSEQVDRRIKDGALPLQDESLRENLRLRDEMAIELVHRKLKVKGLLTEVMRLKRKRSTGDRSPQVITPTSVQPSKVHNCRNSPQQEQVQDESDGDMPELCPLSDTDDDSMPDLVPDSDSDEESKPKISNMNQPKASSPPKTPLKLTSAWMKSAWKGKKGKMPVRESVGCISAQTNSPECVDILHLHIPGTHVSQGGKGRQSDTAYQDSPVSPAKVVDTKTPVIEVITVGVKGIAEVSQATAGEVGASTSMTISSLHSPIKFMAEHQGDSPSSQSLGSFIVGVFTPPSPSLRGDDELLWSPLDAIDSLINNSTFSEGGCPLADSQVGTKVVTREERKDSVLTMESDVSSDSESRASEGSSLDGEALDEQVPHQPHLPAAIPFSECDTKTQSKVISWRFDSKSRGPVNHSSSPRSVADQIPSPLTVPTVTDKCESQTQRQLPCYRVRWREPTTPFEKRAAVFVQSLLQRDSKGGQILSAVSTKQLSSLGINRIAINETSTVCPGLKRIHVRVESEHPGEGAVEVIAALAEATDGDSAITASLPLHQQERLQGFRGNPAFLASHTPAASKQSEERVQSKGSSNSDLFRAITSSARDDFVEWYELGSACGSGQTGPSIIDGGERITGSQIGHYADQIFQSENGDQWPTIQQLGMACHIRVNDLPRANTFVDARMEGDMPNVMHTENLYNEVRTRSVSKSGGGRVDDDSSSGSNSPTPPTSPPVSPLVKQSVRVDREVEINAEEKQGETLSLPTPVIEPVLVTEPVPAIYTPY